MIKKCRQKLIAKAQLTYSKVSMANLKAERANAQSRSCGILFALANGKLYFEFLKIFSVPENTCACSGQNASEVSVF